MFARPASAPQETWSVYGKVAGPALPTHRVRIGNAIVGPPPAGFSLFQPSAPTIEWQADLTVVTATGPHMDIRSDCWVAFENLSASTVDEAIERVETEMVPRLVGALSHRNLGAPYRIHIVGASDGKESFGDSRIVMTVSYEKTPLPDDWAAYANFRASCITSNRHLTVAAELFHRGIRYQDLVAGRLTLAASVLAFYQTLEACARIPEWSPPTTYEAERAQILGRTKTELDRKSTPKKQALAVQKAATDLNRLENKYGDQRIFQAAESFGLDADWRRQARDLGKLRNKSLGHASSLAAWSDLLHWEGTGEQTPESAAAVASRMLDAAIDFVAGAPSSVND